MKKKLHLRIGCFNMPKPKKMAICHPTKINHAKGMCSACYTKQLRDTNPKSRQAHRDAQKRYKITHPEKLAPLRRAAEQRYRYGLSTQDYNFLLAVTKGRCEICNMAEGKICIDHDHACCSGTKTCGKCI